VALTLIVAVLCLISATPTAEARLAAAPPLLSEGNRGDDVLALQHLLLAQGQEVSVDGVYGPQTGAAVRGVQSRAGLRADGVVGGSTWEALLENLEVGARGEPVRALQAQLVSKRRTPMEVDGHYGPATQRAVRSFQAHAQLSKDGVAGAGTWSNLLGHFVQVPQDDTLCAYGDGRSKSYEMWGTSNAVGQLQAAAASWKGAGGRGRVAVGDLSREHGGDIANHSTHEVGLDVDVRPFRKDGRQCSEKTWWSWSTYDRAATRRFVRAVRARAPDHVKLIYFNDPALIREGLTERASGHDNHLHIRYCEPRHKDRDYRCD